MSSNKNKGAHGRNAKSALKELVHTLKTTEYITEYEENYSLGYPDYDPKQFVADFHLLFEDDSEWIVFTTTSERSDRTNGIEWKSLNLKQINPEIDKVYLVYADSTPEKEVTNFLRLKEKIANKDIVSNINDVVSQKEFSRLAESHATKHLSSGKLKDKIGRNMEDIVNSILLSETNFEKWKNNDSLQTGLEYDIYEKILQGLQLSNSETKSISSTTTIPLLPSKGNPKTDILVSSTDNSETISHHGISCKRSSSDKVTVHQYKAEDFISALDITEPELKSLLFEFQKVGGVRAFGHANELALTKGLKKYNRALAEWVFGGKGGAGTGVQNADYLLTYDNNSDEYDFYSIPDYIDLYETQKVRGQFGTIFSWTFAAGGKGKSIQLKAKIL